MKKIILSVVMLITALIIIACPVCDRQQPKMLRGITHGSGPQSNWDYLIISVITFVVLATLFLSIKWLVNPGERSGTHIKHLVLNNE